MARWLALLTVLVAASCGGPIEPPTLLPTMAPTLRPSVDHPIAPTDVVLRMTMFSAIPYPGVTYQGPPDFTLYGDGHTIYKGSGQRELRHAQLTEAQIQQVITRAVEQGRLADA